MVTMPSMLVPTVSSSARPSLPLHERTSDTPMPSVVGTAAGGGGVAVSGVDGLPPPPPPVLPPPTPSLPLPPS